MKINRFIKPMIWGIVFVFTASAAIVSAQTLSITFTKTPSARVGAVDYSVKWTDAGSNPAYHYIVNTSGSFLITKRNARPLPPITVRECIAPGLDAAKNYYIHIAPVDNRGTILKTQSFKLF
jgi:hypothetical protein